MYERNYHKAVLKTEEKPTKQSARINWKLIVWIVVVGAVAVGFVLVTRMPKLQVKNIEVVGAHVADPGDVTEFVNQHLQGHKLFLLPRSSILLVPEHAIENDLRSKFSRFQTVEVKRKNFSTLTITVSEYQGIYLWCTDEQNCYFMDQNGVAFAPAPYFSGSAYPKIFVGTLQPLPFAALSPDQLAMVSLLLDRLPATTITPSEFHFVSDHEVDVIFNHDGHQATLLLDPTTDTKAALEVLFTGLRTNPLAGKFHDASQVLQYIDLRFSDRVVYKFQ